MNITIMTHEIILSNKKTKKLLYCVNFKDVIGIEDLGLENFDDEALDIDEVFNMMDEYYNQSVLIEIEEYYIKDNTIFLIIYITGAITYKLFRRLYSFDLCTKELINRGLVNRGDNIVNIIRKFYTILV